MTFFPNPTGAGDPMTGLNNFTKNSTSSNPSYSFDIKGDQIFSERSRLSGRYSRQFGKSIGPAIFNNPADPNASEGTNRVHNVVLEHTWNPAPSVVWTNRAGVERQYGDNRSPHFDPTSIGFPPILLAGAATIFPRLDFDNGAYASLGTYGWTDTIATRTQWLVDSTLSKIVGPHNVRFGGEQRTLFVNFWQPGFPGGNFQFSRNATLQNIFSPDPSQGNALASMLLDFGEGGGLNLQPGTATKSKETAFFVQDDWRVTQRLTVNLGLRYEWSTPYTERFNRIQIADFSADTGIDVPGVGRIHGVNRFADDHHRTVDPDRNNLAPRLGLAYRVGRNTVVRAGAGVYYGVNPLTNSWLTGSAFRKYAVWRPSLDSGVTSYATLENPFPTGVVFPQGRKYGNFNMWGFSSGSVMSEGFRNAEIYQWNVGIQQQLSNTLLFEVAYSASRSTHLPFGGAENLNRFRPEVAKQWGSKGLAELVPNPFQPLFKGPNAVFNEPDSLYNRNTIPRRNLLRPFPQFDGAFSGAKLYAASARYNSLQLRMEKRYSHGLNLVGSYTFSKATDDSSRGNNSWLGNSAPIQNYFDRRGEWSVGGSDTPHRIVFGGSYELPVGRGKLVGRNLNRVLDGVVGGWQVNSFFTYQSGNPLYIGMAAPKLAYGVQRPNISGDPRGSDIRAVVDGSGNYFNVAAFSAPRAQETGNSPRFNSLLRSDTIHNMDFSVFKNFRFRENLKLQLRGEFFNFTNTPRFNFPNTSFGDPGFGTINSQLNNPRRSQMGARFLW